MEFTKNISQLSMKIIICDAFTKKNQKMNVNDMSRIISDNSRVTIQTTVVSLPPNSTSIIYDHNMFIYILWPLL